MIYIIMPYGMKHSKQNGKKKRNSSDVQVVMGRTNCASRVYIYQR